MPVSNAPRPNGPPVEDPARQELPAAEGGEAPLSPVALYHRVLLGNACAALRSAEILAAGGRVCNAAAFALALTAIEDAYALLRARQSCRSTGALLAVEHDHAVRMAGETVRRMGLMTRIAWEVGEEAAYPVRVRFDLLLENLRRVAFF